MKRMIVPALLICISAFAQEQPKNVGSGHVPAHGPVAGRACTSVQAEAPGKGQPIAGAMHFDGDPKGHPYHPHVDAVDDKWVGHDTCADDPHYHLDHPWAHGRFTGGLGPDRVFTLAVDKVPLRIAEWIAVESGRLYFDNYYWLISRYDYDTAAHWKWAGDRMAIYEDPVHDGWYLAYDPDLGTYTHVEYVGSGAPPELATQGPKRLPTFENDEVIMNEPHAKMHTHRYNRVMIYGTKGGEFLHALDGTTVDLKWDAGQVLWSPSSPMHYSEIPTTEEIPRGPRGLDIGLKKPGIPGKPIEGELDPLQIDPQDFKLEFENNQVRVLRLKLAPQRSVPLHEYDLNRVLYFYTDQNVRETSADGKSEVKQHKAGDFVWEAGQRKLKLDNLSDKLFEAIVVELKQ